MAIRMIKIQNFKSFKGPFSLYLNKGVNVLVGDNESGKSTILEAIHLALTGLYCGRNIRNELSQYLFNNEIVGEYLKSIHDGMPIAPPALLIEIYFDEPINAELFEGNENTEGATKVEGLQFIAIQEINKGYPRQKTNQHSRKDESARKPEQYHAGAGVII